MILWGGGGGGGEGGGSHLCKRGEPDIAGLCHGMALMLLLHCWLLLMLQVTGNWSDQLMERVLHDL